MTARIALHFHPGWAFGESTVLDAIAASGVYRSQWETGTSNGGLTAFPGGNRWRWESRLFEGRYDEADAADRPVYGAWDRHDDSYGAAPRFGSAYLRLRPEVSDRATFCWPDSVYDPQATGGRRGSRSCVDSPMPGSCTHHCSPKVPPTCHSMTP